jgi:hypothetical protein
VASASHPDDLPELCRAHVDNLVATLSDEKVVGRAAEELRDLVSAVVIHWVADAAAHRVEIEGKLLERLQTENPAVRAGRLLVCVVRLSWLRGQDLNLRPSGYEPDELPGCSTPRRSTEVWYGMPRGLLAIGFICIVLREVSLFRSGGDLLSHVLRRSTIGVGTLIGRVRDGIGSFVPAMTTRPEKRQGTVFRRSPNISDCSRFSRLRAFDDLEGKVFALLFPDQIKPIGQLVPVS